MKSFEAVKADIFAKADNPEYSRFDLSNWAMLADAMQKKAPSVIIRQPSPAFLSELDASGFKYEFVPASKAQSPDIGQGKAHDYAEVVLV